MYHLTTHRLYILEEIETINFFGGIFALSMNNLGIFKVCYNYFGDVNLGVLLCLLPSYIRRLPYGYRLFKYDIGVLSRIFVKNTVVRLEVVGVLQKLLMCRNV